jgi:hypothetical protein
VKTFLAKHGVDLASADSFLFKTINALKGKRFQDVEDIKKNVMAEHLWKH